MTTMTLITELSTTISALTPTERWQAARGMNNNFMAEQWFIVAMASVLVVLTILLLWVSYRRLVKRNKEAERLFVSQAEKRGLSVRERQILIHLMGKSGLKRSDDIFTMAEAFDHGAEKMMEELIARRSPQDSGRLRAELSVIRQKLGFERSTEKPLPAKSKKLSSRQIPAGKTLYITRRTAHPSDTIEATVTESSDAGLTVTLKVPVKVTFGETWRVSYYFGASVWEFDTSVISYDGNILVMNHSDNVRFVNRRRFVRVPVKNLAYISRFPFARTLSVNGQRQKERKRKKSESDLSSWKNWEPLEFVHAVVTELAGPGLRVEAPLEVEVGGRVLVIFKLDEQTAPEQQEGQTAVAKIVEDIGEVRRCEATDSGFSIAIELIGLQDSDVSELVRAANSVSLENGAKVGDEQASDDEENVSNLKAVQSVTVEGK
jgi:hypothetical protein